MAVTQYNYTISTDTANGAVDSPKLTKEININTSIVPSVDHIDVIGDVLDVYMAAALDAGEQTELTNTVGAHDGIAENTPYTVELKSDYSDAEHVVKTQEMPRSGDSINYYSPNFCDQCTWYENVTNVSDFELTDSGDLTTWNTNGTHPGPWIDLTHGRMFKENTLIAETPSLVPVIEVDTGGGWVVKNENTWDVSPDGDFSIDYENGTVTFNSALNSGDKVRASFAKAPSTFYWALKPLAGKRLKLLYIEIQFSKDSVMNSSMVYETWAYNPYDLPNKVKVAPDVIYKTFRDIAWESTGPYPVIPAVGGSVRGMTQDLITMPFKYQTFKDIKYSQGVEIRMVSDQSGAFGGSYASATFYCLQMDE